VSDLFFDSFETYATVTAMETDGGWAFDTGTAGIAYPPPSILMGGGVDGQQAMGFQSGQLMRYPLPAAESKLIVGFKLYIVSLPSGGNTDQSDILDFFDDSYLDDLYRNCALTLDPLGYLHISAGSGISDLAISAAPLPTGRWLNIAIYAYFANPPNGEAQVYVDTNLAIDLSGVDLLYSAITTQVVFSSGVKQSTGITSAPQFYIDSLYIRELDSTPNDIITAWQIDELDVNAEGTTNDFTASSGTNNAAMVDDTLPSHDMDDSYVYSATTANKDLFDMDALSVPGDLTLVQAVMVTAEATKSDSGAKTFKLAAHVGATDYYGSNETLGETYAEYRKIWQQDPDTTATWTQTGVNNAEFGFEVVS
jgi:hypothetical protein